MVMDQIKCITSYAGYGTLKFLNVFFPEGQGVGTRAMQSRQQT